MMISASTEQKLDLKPLRISKIRPLEKMGMHPTRLGQPAEQYDYSTKPDRHREIIEFFNFNDFSIINDAQKAFNKRQHQTDEELQKLVKGLQSGDQILRLESGLILLYYCLGKYQSVKYLIGYGSFSSNGKHGSDWTKSVETRMLSKDLCCIENINTSF